MEPRRRIRLPGPRRLLRLSQVVIFLRAGGRGWLLGGPFLYTRPALFRIESGRLNSARTSFDTENSHATQSFRGLAGRPQIRQRHTVVGQRSPQTKRLLLSFAL